MKIELKKETRLCYETNTSDTRYYTEVDGEFVNYSLYFDEKLALDAYENICKNKGKLKTISIETLKTYIL